MRLAIVTPYISGALLGVGIWIAIFWYINWFDPHGLALDPFMFQGDRGGFRGLYLLLFGGVLAVGGTLLIALHSRRKLIWLGIAGLLTLTYVVLLNYHDDRIVLDLPFLWRCQQYMWPSN